MPEIATKAKRTPNELVKAERDKASALNSCILKLETISPESAGWVVAKLGQLFPVVKGTP